MCIHPGCMLKFDTRIRFKLQRCYRAIPPAVSLLISLSRCCPLPFSHTLVSLSEPPYSLHKYVWALALLKKGVMFSDDKNWFPISSTMTASFPATQAIWPTLLRLPGAVDQGDSCLHLRPRSLRSERERFTPSFHSGCLHQKLVLSFGEFKILALFLDR